MGIKFYIINLYVIILMYIYAIYSFFNKSSSVPSFGIDGMFLVMFEFIITMLFLYFDKKNIYIIILFILELILSFYYLYIRNKYLVF